MKKLIFLSIIIVCITSCDKDDGYLNGNFEFIAEYSATIVVGGVVGITERTFKPGEIYNGYQNRKGIITIRIAKHTELNEDCPNSWCYQEFLDVPERFMRLVK